MRPRSKKARDPSKKAKKRKLPPGITKLPGGEAVELIFGKSIRQELDKIAHAPDRRE